ncbi:hypothetical protein AB0A69_30940 [Streptomyces sp. NPDC045431]|uniref:hypothetical protein n=1 Tax=Streptomyces sp. NPDC045431 TaxID=3155613 RepID=UPI0033F6169C
MLAETVCSAVSAAGLGIAAIAAYRRRFLAATRIAAYALVPLGLVMTGAVEWTAFSPVAWAGFGVLGVAWLLFATGRAVERRRAGRRAQPDAVAPAASAPSLGAGSAAPRRPAGKSAPKSASKSGPAPADDFSDIEAILKKHGI